MSLSRSNPISLDVVESLPAESLTTQIDALTGRIRDVDLERADWLKKQLKLIKLRYGIRKRRSVPWKNASNISIPLIDKTLRQWRPGMASLVLDAEPVAFFTPQEISDFDPARTTEPFFTWYFTWHMQTPPEVVKLVDLVGSRGHGYTREGWKYRTHKSVRIAPVSHFFPNGVQAEITAIIEDAQAKGQDPPLPEEIVAQRLVQEYTLDMSDPAEAGMVAEGARKILSGAEFVRVSYREVLDDRADWVALDPINCITPVDEDPEDASFFCIIHDLTRDRVVEMAEAGVLDVRRVMPLLDDEETFNGQDATDGTEGTAWSWRQQIRDVHNLRAGVQDNKARTTRQTLPVWEIYCRLQLEAGKPRERCVLWYSPTKNVVLALSQYVLPFKTWPITLYMFNQDSGRPIDARGIPEMLIDFQRLVNSQHNNRLDAAQLLLSPVFKVKSTADGKAASPVNWRPGAKIPLKNPETDLVPLIHDLRLLGELLQEEQVSQRLAETYVGSFDATLTNLEQSRERRTALEVQAIQQISGSIFGLDAKIFAIALSRSFTKIWQLYDDLGPERMFFRVQGEEKPRLALKSEISMAYDIRAAGTPANTNKAAILSNVERVLPVLLNPAIIQTGVVDLGALLSMWLKLVDYNLSRNVIRPPEEAAAVQQILQAASIANGGEQVQGF
jgi:hypothetical protein